MSDDTNVIDIRAAVEERRRAEEAQLAEAGGDDKPNRLTSAKIKQCLNANELGDGTLFAWLNRGRFCYVKSCDRWLVWRGHHWEWDTMEERFQGVEAVCEVYLGESLALNEDIGKALAADQKDEAAQKRALRDEYLKRVKRLRSGSGATNCLTYAHRIEDPIAIHGNELDRNPWLLACNNGVVDLRTGLIRPGRPEDWLVKHVPHDYKGTDQPCPIFDAFLAASLDGDPMTTEAERLEHQANVTEFLWRALGYGITGLSTEHFFLVFNGQGRNGKGILVETIRYVLGSAAGPIPAEMLLDQGRAANPNTPSPHIMALKGMRLAFASETDEGRRFSPGQVKWYSGGDTLKGRDLHAKDFVDFEPTHLLILLTNNLPHAPGDDFAFWQRLKLIPFHYSFVSEPDPNKRNQRQRDEHLREKLKYEASGILGRLVRGCLEWQRDGLCPPPQVTQATEEYRLKEDTISQFVEDCCLVIHNDPAQRENATDMYSIFKRWYRTSISSNPKALPSQKKFGTLMKKQYRGEKCGGSSWYYGLQIRDDINTLYPEEQSTGRSSGGQQGF